MAAIAKKRRFFIQGFVCCKIMDTKLVVYTTQRITDDDRKHDGGDGHVEPILLHDEIKKRENHTGDWCEDEDKFNCAAALAASKCR